LLPPRREYRKASGNPNAGERLALAIDRIWSDGHGRRVAT
jgi:hypothetical protein